MAHIKQFEHLKINLKVIKKATNNFAAENCIGKGGFGEVYKGETGHYVGHTMVAFKRSNPIFGQGYQEFWNEIMILSSYKHKNIVSLLGYCDECGERILVYEYLRNGSLEKHVKDAKLTWVHRLTISIGVARGLVFLHSANGTGQRAVHRDIKSSNILIDENWDAKISDLGLSKLCPTTTTVVTNPVGTDGYVDPLYAFTGELTKECDVFSFGVVMFELLCGQLCSEKYDHHHQPFIGKVRQSYKRNAIEELVYGYIKDEIFPSSLKMFSSIAFQCLEIARRERPLAIEILRALETALHFQIEGIEFETQPVGIVNLRVLKAMKLKRVYNMFSPSTYVKLSLTADDMVPFNKTKVVKSNLNPVWNEEFDVLVRDIHLQALEIVVIRDKGDNSTNYQWKNFVALKHLIPEEKKTHTLDLFKNKKPVGKIVVEILYKQILRANQGGGLLVVTITEGRHLEKKNPIIYLKVLDESLTSVDKRQTMHAKNSKWPTWNENFDFTFNKQPTGVLSLHVHGSSLFRPRQDPHQTGKNFVNISLVNVPTIRHINEFYKLSYPTNENACLHVDLFWRSFS